VTSAVVRLGLHVFPAGVTTPAGARAMVYDRARDTAHFGAATVNGPALVWRLDPASAAPAGALVSRDVSLAPGSAWLMRCDRVDFPPGGVAHTHVHPGPGIRYLLHGRLAVRSEGHVAVYGPGEAWFEAGPDPVEATDGDVDTAFVRVLVLPAEWAGRRTIRYVDPADADRPRLQRATVYLEREITGA
jgi:quercetin dioxygenase-like cupin family protein